MTVAYWCVLAAALMPLVFTGIAKIGPGRYDNRAPREFLGKLSGYRQRANWAQMNSLEAFPPFAAGVIIAHQVGAAQDQVDLLALAFIGLRLLYGAMYLLDWATLRSLVWMGGLACAVGEFVLAARVG
jgi:uncharacterized MAPEG superfamily protein